MMRLSNIIAVIALSLMLVFVGGCNRGNQFHAVFSEDQTRRATVIEDFAQNPATATEKYRALWGKNFSNTENAYTLSPVILLAIAGELMVHDRSNYDQYYNYVFSYANHHDAEILSSSLSALSRANGRESLDALIRHAEDSRDVVAREAMTAINYRLASSMYDPAATEEKNYLLSLLPVLCKQKHKNELAQFCN